MAWSSVRRACPDCGTHVTGRLSGAPGVAFVCGGCLSVFPAWPTVVRQAAPAVLSSALRRLWGGRS